MSKKKKTLIIGGSIILLTFIILFTQRARIRNVFKKAYQPVADSKPVTISYWGLFQPEQVMAPLIAEYQELHPNVTINYQERKFENDLGEYKTNLKVRLKQGNGPTIFRMHSTWTPQFISEIGWTDTVITKEDFDSRFYSVASSQCTASNGEILCVPLMYDGLVLLYNVDMFSDIGANEPESWEDVRSVANRLVQEGVAKGGVALGTSNNVANSSDILALMMTQNGASIPEGFDSPEGKTAINFYKSFNGSGWNSSMRYSTTAFAREEVGMVFAKRWQILEILQFNPTLNLGVLTLPQIPKLDGTTTNNTWASFWVESVSKDATEQEQKAAWEFIDWLSRPEQQEKLFAESSKYMRFGEVYSDKSISDKIINSPILGPIVEQAPYATTSIVSDIAGNDEYVSLMNRLINGENPTGIKVEYQKLLKQK